MTEKPPKGYFEDLVPETPDLDQIARVICERFDAFTSNDVHGIADQLRHVWNARVCADVQVITDFRMRGLQTEHTHREALIGRLRRLDTDCINKSFDPDFGIE